MVIEDAKVGDMTRIGRMPIRDRVPEGLWLRNTLLLLAAPLLCFQSLSDLLYADSFPLSKLVPRAFDPV